VVAQGDRAVMLYVVQRRDCKAFSIAADIDPAYGAALTDARSKGVETLCYVCKIRLDGVTLDAPLPMAV
jgi:sugar fermentation stimulation protein A